MGWQSEKILSAVRLAHQQYDVVVVSIHWGEEYVPQANAWQREAARALVDMGADLVVGHHPHTVQGSELFGRTGISADDAQRVSLVAYSLGNFVFDQVGAESGIGMALRVFVTREGLQAAQALPVWTYPDVHPMPVDAARNVLDRMRPPAARVWFTCKVDSCRLLPDEVPGKEAIGGILWSGQIDFSGDGEPETVRRTETGLEIHQAESLIWYAPPEWKVLDFALGDPNNDGRAEMMVALQKPDSAGVLRSHPFMVGFRGGIYRLMWGGSAVAEPIQEVEVGDLDGDGLQELVVLESQPDGRSTLGIWRWHGWGFSLIWRSPAAKMAGLRFAKKDGNLVVEVGIYR